MSLRYALLGMLAYAPASGYDLTKDFERGNVGRYAWQAGHTQIYPELNRLAEEGLIEVVEEGARGRRSYRTTGKGRAVLRSWMFGDADNDKVRNTGVLRLFLMSALEADDALILLKHIGDRNTAELDHLSKVIAELDESDAGGRAPFGRLAGEYGKRVMAAERDWAKWAAEYIAAHPGRND